MLATLKARAAYVPIDASIPPARLDYLLEDSGARVVLVGEGVAAPPAPADLAVIDLRGRWKPKPPCAATRLRSRIGRARNWTTSRT